MKSIGKGEWKNKVEIAFSGQAPVLRRLVAYWLEVLGDDKGVQDAAFFSDKESPFGANTQACLMDCWFEDKIQSGEEWSAGLRTGYFFFCEIPLRGKRRLALGG